MVTFTDKIRSLQQAAAGSPEYAEILPFFIELFRFLDARGKETGISIRIAEDRAPVQIANGLPLVAPDSVQVNLPVCTTFLRGIIELLGRIGREGSAELTGIDAALNDGSIDPAAIFTGILERRRSVIDDAASSAGVPAPLLEYLFEIPLKTALELFAVTLPPDSFPEWQESHCPVCGSRAGMAELAGEEGKRYLCCSTCTFRWPFKRLQCPFCNNEDVDKLSYFMAGTGATRVDTCKACSRYIKTRDSRNGALDTPLDLEDLLTMHLDLLAAREGFERGK